MRETWLMKAAPVITAAALIACSREVGDDEGGGRSDRRNFGGGRVDQTIGLKGCVQGAPQPGEYILRNVQLNPLPTQPTDSATSVGISITDGSSIRLHITDSDQLKKNLGQIVSVTGTITDDGRSTIGTAGKPRDPDQAGAATDASRTATSEPHYDKQAKEAGPLGQDAMANGTLPIMSVQKVNRTGERCRLELKPERR
jgi:hypothetical protein